MNVNWFLVFLFLHIAGAIVGFGPTLTFPIIGIQNEKMPQGALYTAMIVEKVSRGLVVPAFATMPVTGIAMVLVAHINLFATPYLLVALVLWAIVIGIGTGIQLPSGKKLVELLSAPRPEGAMGPPAGVLELAARTRMFGMIQVALVTVIVFMMVFHPGGLH